MINGTVTNITDFGLFVEVEEGIEGLVHVSEISRKKVKSPSEMFKEGDTIEAKVIHVSADERRLGLSIKQTKEEAVGATGGARKPKSFGGGGVDAGSTLGDLLREKLEEAASDILEEIAEEEAKAEAAPEVAEAPAEAPAEPAEAADEADEAADEESK
jgi:small subunit ribosomal protein S1